MTDGIEFPHGFEAQGAAEVAVRVRGVTKDFGSGDSIARCSAESISTCRTANC